MKYKYSIYFITLINEKSYNLKGDQTGLVWQVKYVWVAGPVIKDLG